MTSNTEPVRFVSQYQLAAAKGQRITRVREYYNLSKNWESVVPG